MRTPAVLRKLDDRFLGDRFRPGGGEHRDRDEHHDRDTPASGPRSEAAGVSPDEPRTRVVSRERRPAPSTGDGLRQFLAITYRIASLVFVALALAVGLGILFTVAPTNADNVIVRNVLDVADAAAGPFRDVFTAGDEQRRLVTNYGFAAGVYLLAALLVGKLPGGRR